MVYREIDKLLRKNGWVLTRTTGSHFQYKHIDIIYIATVPNHGKKDISIGVIRSLEKVTGLSFLKR